MAATTDEAVVRQIVEGRFEELRRLEPLAQAGDAVAQHWWAHLLNACAYGECGPAAACALWLQAAKSGNERSRELLFFTTAAGPDMARLVAEIGEPVRTEERLSGPKP